MASSPDTIGLNSKPGQKWNVGHILLASDLRHEDLTFLSKENVEILAKIFPGTTGLARYGSHLHFVVKELPTRPWPLTIGGILFTISTDAATPKGRAGIFPRTRLGHLQKSLRPDLDGRQDGFTYKGLRELAAQVFDHFKTELPDVRILELMWMGTLFYIVVGDEVDILQIRPRLPGKIAQCVVSYLYDKQVPRPIWADLEAQRVIEPRPDIGVIDDTPYEQLRPGVLLQSKARRDHGHPATHSTTSGVLLENAAGEKLMTGASQGIGEDETVFQELPQGQKRVVGKAMRDISFTDVSLIQLESDREFVNKVFEHADTASIQLKKLAGENLEDTIGLGDRVYVSTPHCSPVEGVVLQTSFKLETRPPGQPIEESLSLVAYEWVYMGQVEPAGEGGPMLPEGACGSAIWDDAGTVRGFFHHFVESGPYAGFVVATSASEVARAGYRLSV
ncbi:hypothetical protein MAPG_09993 [Magnaporthiopsis poae ATCC 64411]|uniref:Uncharacterized protein n=1 Tax=Magnaporthiopsis poae (strain ATCC 64411 / 73-15) TaxID=644358 RepID=A0A0C4EBE6_MAGP6|nr:hypothetical protein MAPG_09993 [Magnaporthiopsis poae ATCC 64411]